VNTRLPFTLQNEPVNITLGYDPGLYQAGKLIAEALDQDRQVFLYAPEGDLISFLGLEGNPYFGFVNNYLIEVSREPTTTLPEYDYGISKQLTERKIDTTEWWINGFRGHLGEIHAALMYYLARSGMSEAALAHKELANKLTNLPKTKEMIDYTYENGSRKWIQEGSYMAYVVPQIDEYILKGDQQKSLGEMEKALYFWSRAWLLAPHYEPVLVRLRL
jgi:hypothetical protein